MDFDDVVYLSLLTFTVVFGHFFRQMSSGNSKKTISTVVGFLMVLSVSGIHVLHSIVFITVNALLVLYTSKRFCHVLSFAFSFLYLIFFRTTAYFGISYPPNHTNLIQMIMTLKLVGLAFEVHDSYIQDSKSGSNESKGVKSLNWNQLNFCEIVHYSYCHIGVLTGPYYSYKTFSDYYNYSFYKYINCDRETVKTLKFLPAFAVSFLLFSHYYPVKYAQSDAFYSETSFWYRLWYITPVFISFRMRLYVGLALSEAACVMAGLGAYPSATKPKSGMGPSENFDIIEKLKEPGSPKSNTQFDFDTVVNIRVWHTEADPLVRSSIRYWNMCVQYWMANIVHRRFPFKPLRVAATFAVSALWHGVYAGYYFCLCSVPFYLVVEDMWDKMLRRNATGMKRKVIDVAFWVVRTQAFSYMGMAFSLLTLSNNLRYYASVYYVYHITTVLGLVVGLLVSKAIKTNSKSEKRKKLE